MDGNSQIQPFRLRDCALAAIATGERAHNLRELRDAIIDIHPGSIDYHFWGGLLRPRYEDREYNNDFAIWSSMPHGLHDDALAERLGVIDPTDYEGLDDLRHAVAEVLSQRLDESEKMRLLHADRPFQFIRSQIVVFDTGLTVSTPRELAEVAPRLSPSSFFFHVIDARRRTPASTDDFRAWIGCQGEEYAELCRRLAEIDPYFSSLSNLKATLVSLFTEYFAGGA